MEHDTWLVWLTLGLAVVAIWLTLSLTETLFKLNLDLLVKIRLLHDRIVELERKLDNLSSDSDDPDVIDH